MIKINFFCINLKSRYSRWVDCQRQFKAQELNVIRWNATPLPENRRFGAGLSHREIIELAKNKNWDYVGVFEDDINFLVKDFQEQYRKALQELKNKNWYILYFGGFVGTGGKLKRENGINKLLRVNRLFEAHAVIYNKAFYDIYLKKHPDQYSDKIHELYIDDTYSAFDQWFAEVVQSKYPCYITNTILVSQRDDFSTIENKFVNRNLKSVYRFYIYKYFGTKIATFLEACGAKLKTLLK